jgi:hypothetical protein
MLNIHEYATGVASFRSDKYPLVHEPSQSILGNTFVMCAADLSYFFTLLPHYLREFGVNGNIESVNDSSDMNGISLTEYEHEVAFLMTMNWSYKQIAQFMDKYRPRTLPRTPDTIYKCRDRVRDKLDCEPWELRDKLIEMGLHRKMPRSFFDRLIRFGNIPIPL